MNAQSLYSALYRALRIFHWTLFAIVVEIVFTIAGWMIGGLLVIFLAWVLNIILGQDYSAQFSEFFQPAGKVLGALSGILFTRFILIGFAKR